MPQDHPALLPQAIADLAQQVIEAAGRTGSAITETPVEQIVALAPDAGVELFFKLEHLQQTGSFKLRGASNKILSLSPGDACALYVSRLSQLRCRVAAVCGF